ncbi:MAG: LysR substrate-binding domain-containing protein [Siculibacillus sp.]|nr:LysR substrate-binding domain-containing protein [Siculibacillus sp.]
MAKAPKKSTRASTEIVQPRGSLPPLSSVRAFEAVGRLSSMRRAAVELSVCHTVVSRHVRNLETWLGARLLERSPRGILLTDEGRLLLRSVSGAFDLIASAASEIRPTTTRGLFRVWCVPGLAARWLAPRLADLQTALPGVEIVLRATKERPNFAHYEADGEISYGEEPEGGGPSERLERSRLFPVASPAWLASHPSISTLSDLAGVKLIHEESRDQWRRWFERAGHTVTGELAGPRLWYASSALDAAVAGQGVALATRLQAADDIVAGRLVEICATDVTMGDYWFVAPQGRWNDPVVSRFRAWLARSIAETRGGERPGDRSPADRSS